jgi:tRNA modification GTPase
MTTIFALSSGAPPAGIAVVRLSGPASFETVRALAGKLPEPRHATLATLCDPKSGEPLDRALLLIFPAPASATGEDVAELHLHGGRAVVRAVEAVLAALPGMRRAEPGEFTRRALLSGRIDLSEAEGLGDLLTAETEAQRRTALRTAEGAVRREVEGWAIRALSLAAQVEALLDHSDEDDVADGAEADLQATAAALAADIAAVAARPTVERLRDGVRVVLAGPPNAGKSTLFNALADRDAAIVSPIAGTTRDRIEAPVVRNGVAFVLIDTAGLAEASSDAIETIGIARAREAAAEADVLLWLGDDAPPSRALWIHARADEAGRDELPPGKVIAASAATGEGIEALWDLLSAIAEDLLPPPDLVALNRRQRDLCISAAVALREAAGQQNLLLFAEHLRSALRAFDAITGRADVEAMLDALFARFCIGK